MASYEKVSFKGWSNCARLSNKQIELIVTGDVGPRVIRLGFIGKGNLFAEYADMLGKTGGDEWRIYGGHRLWHAPEHPLRTYFPDNNPVTFEDHGSFLRVKQPVEPTTNIEKQIDLTLDADKAHVRVVHRLVNHGAWDVTLSIWALSVMAPGGVCVLPQPPRGSHPQDLLPANSLTLWPYTSMSDPRWTWGEKYILLRQDAKAARPQKIGASVPDGWAAYALNGDLFVNRFKYVAGAAYPDLGSCFETFTNADMLEVETLSPILTLAPGASAEHVEDWYLFDGVTAPSNDASIERDVLPRIAQTR